MEPHPSTDRREPGRFWIGLALILVAAAVPHFLGYDYSLPYVENSVEPNYVLAAQSWRGEYDDQGYYQGFPPGYILISAIVQEITSPLGIEGTAGWVAILRFVAVLVSLATLICIALTARLAGGDVAGWVAGAAWGVSTVVLSSGMEATPDPFVYFLVALSLWMAVRAVVDDQRRGLAVWSVATGLLAIYFKYPVISAVLPGILAAVYNWSRERRLRHLLMQAGLLIMGTPYLLVLLSQANEREAAVAKTEGLRNILTMSRVANNLYHAAVPVNAIAFGIILALGIAAYVYAARRGLQRVDWRAIALSLVLAISIPWLASAYSVVQVTYRMKDVLPATTAICVMLGAATAQVHHLSTRLPRAIRPLVPLALVLPAFLPMAYDDIMLTRMRLLPDRRVELRGWFDENLEPGTVLVTLENDSTFNPTWGGIPASRWFDWYRSDDITEQSLEYWLDNQMAYAIIPLWQWQQFQDDEDSRAYLDQMLHLRDFTAPPERLGPEMVVYRLWRMQHETAIQFGDRVTLTGYDQGADHTRPGDTVSFRFYWNASATPQENYSLFVHMMPPDVVQVVAQSDGNPAAPGRLTQTWDAPTETLISTLFLLTIPPETPPGDYRVVIGLYNYQTGARLPVADGATGEALGDSYQLAVLTVDE